MDVLILARVQFAITVMFHYLFPVLSIGLSVMMVLSEGRYLWSGQSAYLRMAQFWTKLFALTFALGVATGIVMEFEFGTNWATYSRYVGDVFGSALAAEGVFAFFLESGFLAVVLFGWNRVGRWFHFLSTVLVCLGAHFSAVWIVVANSWMQTPSGYHIVETPLGARAEITDFWAMVFNPSSMARLSHVILGCWLAGAFLVISVAAYYLLRGRHVFFARQSMYLGCLVALVAGSLQLVVGHWSAQVVALHQPSKLAAFEGLYHTQKNAPLTLAGWIDSKNNKLLYPVQLPGMLSYLSFGSRDAEVKGLDQFPKEDWPAVLPVFVAYRIMLLLWAAMMFIALVGVWLLKRGSLLQHRWLLGLMTISAIFPQVANQTGWYCAEVGRYPWIVYGLLRISDGLSKSVSANQVFGSLVLFSAVYLFLLLLFLYLMNEKITQGPERDEEEDSLYHGLQRFVQEEKG